MSAGRTENDSLLSLPPTPPGGLSCDAIGAYLSAYADGELPPPDRAAVEAHPARCASCRDEIAAFAILDEAARRVYVPPIPDAAFDPVFAAVLARVRNGPRADRWVEDAADGLDIGNIGEAIRRLPIPSPDEATWARAWSKVRARTLDASGAAAGRAREAQVETAGARVGTASGTPQAAPERLEGEERAPLAARPQNIRRSAWRYWWAAAALAAAACAAVALFVTNLMPEAETPKKREAAVESSDDDEAEAISPRYQLVVRHLPKRAGEEKSPPVVCFILKPQ